MKGLLAKETFARDILCCSSCKIFVAEKHEKLGALTAELGKWWKVCYAAADTLFLTFAHCIYLVRHWYFSVLVH